jgi:hypothetical protein
MNTKHFFSALIALLVVIGPVTALADKPVAHDHQKTKGSGISSAPKSDTAIEDCKPTGGKVEANSKDAATEAKGSKVKCEPKKPTTPTHDHRKMKTQP